MMDSLKINLDIETIEQVADVLWLSEYIENSTVEVKPSYERLNVSPNSLINKQIFQKKPQEKIESRGLSRPQQKPLVYTPNVDSFKTGIKADPIRMPKKLSLSNYRAWEDSFRSFYYKIDSSYEFILDERKTVDLAAETRVVQPILKPKKIKYFHFIVIVEQSPSMDIWKELVLEFQKTVQRFGVFESIDFYYLSTDNKELKAYGNKMLTREIDYKKINLNSQSILTVVSDCISSAWHSNHIFQMLEFWSKFVPVSITHMFPKRMWQGTALYKGFQTSFKANGFKPLNKQLVSDENYYDDEAKTFNIPIINFEPQSVEAWASVIHAKRGKWIDGVILEDLEELPFPEVNNNKETVLVEARVNRYLSQASPLAQKLALYASVLPINFHVIRILQELKLPESTQIHLAEFFLGGLIKREVDEKQQISFDFYEGVRDYFRNQLTATASYRLQESMSGFVSQNINSSLDFQALINNPNSTSGLYLSKDEVNFVKLRADTLLKLGGNYGKQADNLLKNLVLGEEDNNLKYKLKEEFLENFIPLEKLKNKDIEDYSRIFNYSFGLFERLLRSFSRRYSDEEIKEIEKDIIGVYGEIAWIKKIKKNKILWVEERASNNTELKEKFETIGLFIDIAKFTDEALALIKENPYLVIISNMGRVESQEEGYVLLDEFRIRDKDTPFIFFANSESIKNKKMTLERGGQGSTTNPIELCRMVMNIIEDGKVEEEVVNDSVVLIKNKTNKNFGTGFSIYQDKSGSYILTSKKILEDTIIENIQIDDYEVSIHTIGERGVTDLIILYVKGLFASSLELETNSLSSREVYTIGYGTLKQEYYQERVDGEVLGDKTSIVSSEGVSKHLNLWKVIDFLGKGINIGSLGSPLISQVSGKVIGIVSHSEGGKFYAIPIDYLQNIMDEKSIFPFQDLMPLGLKESDLYFKNKQMNDAVVMISSSKNESFGTGFVIYEDKGGSYVVTTDYIVNNTLTPIVNGYKSVEVLTLNEKLNLAILYVQDLYLEPLKLQDEDISSREVELLGYSRFTNLENRKEVIEATIVSSSLTIVPNEGNSYKAWKIIAHESYKLHFATSGAPLVSKESGKVIAILNSQQGSNIGYAIFIEYLQELISENHFKNFKTLKSFDLEINNSYFDKGHMNKSIVLIASKDKNNESFGTGFVVHQDKGGSYIVTANSVIEVAVTLVVNNLYTAEIIRSSKIFELAILYVKDFYEEAFILQNENFSNREVEIMGYSSFSKKNRKKEVVEAKIISNDLIITDGKDYEYKGWEVVSQQNDSFKKGMAGAPLILKESNKVVGVATAQRGSIQGYAISIEHLKDVWDEQ